MTTSWHPDKNPHGDPWKSNSLHTPLLELDGSGVPDEIALLETKSDTPSHGSYGSLAAYSFTVNFIMGVGVLSLPYAFYHTGLVLSPIFVIFISFLSYITVMYIFETGARAEAIRTYEDQVHETGVAVAPKFRMTNRRFDIRTLASMFLGKWGLHFDIALILFTYGGQWSFASVFASSMTANVPLPFLFNYNFTTNASHCNVYADGFSSDLPCLHTYWSWMLVYALIVVPLSCLDLSDQVWLQLALTCFRFLCVILMVGSTAGGLAHAPFNEPPPPVPNPPYSAPVGLFVWGGFGTLFTTAVFAQMMHNGAPNIVQPLRNKSRIKHIFVGAFTTTFVVYTLVGEMCALYYGSAVTPTVTLMWVHYNGSRGLGAAAPWWASAIKWILVMFPPLDVTSAYPLGAISLGTNLFSALPQKLQKHRRWKLVKLATRLLASVPAIIGALFVWNLSTIISISGLFAFFLVFITPSLLQLRSRAVCMQRFGTAITPFSGGWMSHPATAYSVLGVGVAALGIAVALLINPNLF